MADPIESIPIPANPPAKSGASQGAVAGIAAIIAACDAGGLTSKYAKCALLGIAGVESKWLYSAMEDHTYSTKGIKGTWPRIKDADAVKWNNKPNQYSRVEFFGFIYGTSKDKPASIGNYHGRGFIQVTFPEAYEYIGKKLGVDLVANPDLLIQSPEFGGKVMVEYVKWKMKDWESRQWNSGFFDHLLSKVGGAPAGHPVKRRYYEYFLGGKSDAPPTNKDPSSTAVNKTQAEIDASTPNKREAYSEDRSANFSTIGFTDPEGKYPLRDFLNEPDTNRLARGIIDGTHINFKDNSRKTDIPIANSAGGGGEQGTWDQPKSAYNTVYPFNKVFESESGHVLEFDDSPDGERVNLYHRKGTFIEIDPNGSQINYIVGDGFYITENNGNVFINGTCNITVASELNILCQGNANIEVNGTADVVVHDDLNIGVAKDLNLAVGGDYNILVEGNYNVEVAKTSNTRSVGTMSIESTDALKLKTSKTMSMEGGDTASTAETLMKMSSSFKLETPADFQIKAKTFTLDIENATEIRTGSFKTETTSGKLELKVGGEMDILATGSVLIDTPTFDVNGTPVSISSISALSSLGSPKVPVDFKGSAITGRKEEQVLVDTVLNPAGEYNPNTLSKTVLENLLGGIPLVGDMLSSFGGSTPNVYDVKYTGTPIESKTSLTSTGTAVSPYSKLQVPPVVGSNKPPQDNLVPPERHSDAISKFESEDDWNTPEGQKALAKMTSTSDYEHNYKTPEATDVYKPTGGGGSSKIIPADKLADINSKADYPLNYPLSEHFTLGMLIDSGCSLVDQVALTSRGGKEQVYTKQMIVTNLVALSLNILEPIYDAMGPCRGSAGNATWQISSGFRNSGVKGRSQSSHHLKGRAVDIQIIPNKIEDLYEMCIKLEKLLPYQEYFMEYAKGGSSHWIHVAYDVNDKSKEVMTYVDQKPFKNGLLKMYV